MTLEVEDVHGSGRVGGGSVSELAVVVRAPAFDLAALKERTGVQRACRNHLDRGQSGDSDGASDIVGGTLIAYLLV